ncbi:MAG: response regulator, partial [Chloroflexi bacterium]
DRGDQDRFYLDSRQMLKSKTPHTYQLKMVTQEGAVFDARIQGEARDYNNHTLCLRIGVVDISAQVQTAAALKESNAQLEQTLAELKDTQQRIVQQERLAAVGQLAAGIAHDFNNILTSIIGFSTLLKSSPEMPPKFQTELTFIFDAGQRAARLVQQILDFSRKTIRQPETFDLVDFITEAVRFLRYTLPETIQVSHVLNSDRCMIYADRNQLHQLLTNLAINARDAMPSGGTLKIALSCTTLQPGSVAACPELPAGKWAILSVADTGTGIPPGILPRIYEPFFTTKPAGQGAGLGLSQVYGIVKQYGGCVDVASKWGRGTTFTIYLPLQQGREAPPEPLTAAEYPLGTGEFILLVEDDAAVRQACRAMLKQLNYQVFTAINGQDALTVFLKHRAEISLVLTDIVMPVMDGPALLKELKILAPEVNVVMMTGYPLMEKTSKFLEDGVFDWLHKPISFGQLAQVIHRALKS